MRHNHRKIAIVCVLAARFASSATTQVHTNLDPSRVASGIEAVVVRVHAPMRFRSDDRLRCERRSALHEVGLLLDEPRVRFPAQATLAAVAPGISEALIATAMGLFAAIPAVLAYNRFAAKADALLNRYESFVDEFSGLLQRQSYAQKQGNSQ